MSAASDPDPPRRFLCVFFTDWLIDLESSLLRRAVVRHDDVPANSDHPLVIVEARSRAHATACHPIVACNDAALRAGMRVGMTVNQAEAVCKPFCEAGAIAWRSGIERLRAAGQDPSERSIARRIVAISERLVAIESDGALAARMLVRLGRCLERWIPVVSVPPALQPLLARMRAGRGRPEEHLEAAVEQPSPSADWLVGDFTGCAALFRGVHSSEQGLMRRIEACFRKRGFRVRIATASTIGAATALARFGKPSLLPSSSCTRRGTQPSHRERCIAVPKGSEAVFLANLPVESLRISSLSVHALRAVEVHAVGQLAALGRTGIAARLTGLQAADATEQSACGASVRRPPHASRRSRHVASTMAWSDTPMLFASSAGDARNGSDRAHVMLREGSIASLHASAPSAPSVPSSRTSVKWRAADDVLLRLDQALGVVPELLVPLRLHDPIVIQHAFEAPCSRPEVISRVCSEMVDHLMTRLARRREGLRSATWSFTHADLPADLSTDSLPGIRRPSRHGDVASCAGDQSPCIQPAMMSFIELGLVKPTSRASHVWSVLRTRLEQIALDHGIERIECRVGRATLLRFHQGRLCGPAASALPAGPSIRRGQACERRAALAEWIELVSARIGPASVIQSCDLVDDDDPAPSQVRPRVHRPSAFLPRAECAVLRCGDSSRSIAQSIAARTLWRVGSPRAAGGRAGVRSIGAAIVRAAQLDWRGMCWTVGAIDGWERSLSSWWDSPADRAGACARTHPTGVLSRIAIVTSDGWLWLLVRWPERLPAPRAPTDVAPPECGVLRRMHDGHLDENTDRWFTGSSRSLEQGVELEVIGAWS